MIQDTKIVTQTKMLFSSPGEVFNLDDEIDKLITVETLYNTVVFC